MVISLDHAAFFTICNKLEINNQNIFSKMCALFLSHGKIIQTIGAAKMSLFLGSTFMMLRPKCRNHFPQCSLRA